MAELDMEDPNQIDPEAIDALPEGLDDQQKQRSLAETLNKIQSNRTSDPAIDKSLDAMQFIRTATASGGSYQEIIDNSQTQSADIQREIQEQLIKANTNTEMSESQLIATAILQLAPILIGAAVSGNRGMAIGAGAGALGVAGYQKGIETKAERDRAAGGAQASLLQGQLAGLQKQQISAQNSMLKDESLDRRQERGFANSQSQQQRSFANSKSLAEYKHNLQSGGGSTEGVSNLILDKVKAGQPLSNEDDAVLRADKTLAAQVERYKKDARAVNQLEFDKQDRASEFSLPNHVYIDGKRPSKANSTAAEKIYSPLIETSSLIDEMKLAYKDGVALYGSANYAAQADLSARMVASARRAQGAGANLTGPEIPWLLAQSIRNLDNDGIMAVMADYFKKGPTLERLNVMQDSLMRSGKSRIAIVYGQYDPDEYSLLSDKAKSVINKAQKRTQPEQERPSQSQSSGGVTEGRTITLKDGTKQIAVRKKDGTLGWEVYNGN